SVSSLPSNVATTGSPLVTVPVLSKTIVSTSCVRSKCSPPLNKIPFSAARPVPTIIEVGVARPNAHGQAITNTAILAVNASSNSPGLTNVIQTINVSTAIPTTIRSEEHTSELQSRFDLVCRLL